MKVYIIRLTKKNLSPRLLVVVLFLLLLGCTPQVTNKNTSTTPITDSISSWIAKGKDKKLTKKQRLEFVNKAYLKNKDVKPDSVKIKNLSSISYRYLSLKDSLYFRKTNTETIELSKATKDTTTLANSYWDLSVFFDKESIMDSSYFYYQKAAKLFLDIKNNTNAARMYRAMASIQEDINDNTGAEINCIKAIELLKPLKEYKHLSNCYNTLGLIASNLDELEKSIAYYKEASAYDIKANKRKTNFKINNNLGNIYQRKKEHTKAIPYFKEVIDIKNLESNYPTSYALALNNLTYSRFKLGATDSIKENYEKVLQIRETEKDIYKISASHYYLAEYYLSTKDTTNALIHARFARDYAKEASNTLRLLKSLQLLAQINPINATDYHLEHIKITDSMHIAERKIRNKFARIRFETDEFIAENELLQKQKQLWTGITAGLVLLLIAIYIIVSQRNKNQKLKFTQQQQANNQEVFNLMLAQKEKVDEAKRNEQKRISEELHDGVLGKMLGARMVLTGLNKKADPEAIEEKAKAIAALKNVEGEVRAISHELNHAAYQKIPNFINSIEELLTTLAKNAKIEQEFNFNNTVDWDTLSGDIKINVYRMIQECIHNSIKHAECQKVYVNFDIHKYNFEVTVGDNGKGYEFNKEKKGIGLRNIKSRIEKLNGHFTVDSKLGKGTSFFFNIPISNIKKYEEKEISA
ncbi:tetratricopeptide repeat-containing sensor histidine kinase [uncultured Maribacter sp.]|uniref:tetratricopeptide repeat-containing sensor histidine kinase n=1 Tax=uncultured Maribacter sp. TaxID=431308 RepID=UPI002616502F|nr:tetratricopeptide repeat-containing sensor histidine kinase [uncultured Maribacter sp.]